MDWDKAMKNAKVLDNSMNDRQVYNPYAQTPNTTPAEVKGVSSGTRLDSIKSPMLGNGPEYKKPKTSGVDRASLIENIKARVSAPTAKQRVLNVKALGAAPAYSLMNDEQKEAVDTSTLYAAANSSGNRFLQGVARGFVPFSANPQSEAQEDVNTLVENSLAGQIGRFAGEIGSFAAPYAGLSGAVGKAVTKIPKVANMGKVGQGVVKSVATDLAVGLPLNVNYAYNKEGLRGEEALKSIGVNTALDLGLGAAVEGVAAFAKFLKGSKVGDKIIETADDVAGLTEDNIREIIQKAKAGGATDDEMLELTNFINARRRKNVGNNDTISAYSNNEFADRYGLPEGSDILKERGYPYNVENPNRQTVIITKDEIESLRKEIKDNDLLPRDMRERLKDWFRGNTYKVDGVERLEVPYEIYVAKEGLKEGYEKTDKKAKSIAFLYRLDDIIKNAKYVGSEPDKYGRKNIIRSDIFTTEAEIAGVPRDIRIRSNATANKGNNLYYVGVERGRGANQGGSLSTSLPAARQPLPEDILTDSGTDVNVKSLREMLEETDAAANTSSKVDGDVRVDDANAEASVNSSGEDISAQVDQWLGDVTKEGTGDYGISGGTSGGNGGGITEDIAQSITNKGVKYSKDFVRNVEAAFAKNEKGKKIFDILITNPLMRRKGEYARAVQTKLDGLYNTVVKDLGIKKGSKESAAIQWIGEKQRQVKNEKGRVIQGEYEPYDLMKLKEEFDYTMPNGKKAWENILEAEKYIRGVYNEYIGSLDAVLREIYPNVEDNVARIEAAAAKEQLGVGDKVHSISGRNHGEIVADLGNGQYEVYFKNQKTGNEATVTLSREDLMSASSWQKREDAIVGKRMMPREDYFHHFSEMSKNFVSLESIANTATNIDPRLVGVSEFTQPKSRFWGALQRRFQGEYTEDAVGGLLQYIPQAEYKINIEPIIPQLRGVIRDLKDSTIATRNANDFIKYLMDFTNELAGKTNAWDRAVLNIVGDSSGRTFINIVDKVSQRMRTNSVVGNLRTVLAQGFNIPNVVGYIQNPADLTKGFTDMLKGMSGDVKINDILDKSDFIRERYLDRSIRIFDDDKFLDKLMNKSSWALEIFDKMTAEGSFLSAFYQATKKGLPEDEAIRYADDITRKALGGRGIGEMPIEQRSKMVKMIAPFQVEVRNSLNVLGDMKKMGLNKGAKGLAGIFITSALMNEALEAAFGYEIGFNPLGTAIDTIRDGLKDGDSSGDIAKDTAFNLLGNTVSNIPYGSYIASAVSNTGYGSKIFGEQDPSRFGTGNIAINQVTEALNDMSNGRIPDIRETALLLAPRFGGKQIDRTIDGFQDLGILPRMTVREDTDGNKSYDIGRQPIAGSYNRDGDQLRFAMEPTWLDMIMAPAFGSFTTSQGKEYIREGYKPLSEKRTSTIEDLAARGYDPLMLVNAVRDTSDFAADKDAVGNSISGSKKQKYEDYLRRQGLNPTAISEIMERLYGYAPSSSVDNNTLTPEEARRVEMFNRLIFGQ